MVEKEHMNLAMIGHIDHGKSTLLGRLLTEAGAIDPHIIEEYRKKAAEIGKATFEYAWVMDTLADERERGITIDVAHQRFDTNKYYYTIVDCPGHRDFVKNMITGTSQADAAVLVVDAKDGIMAQTKEHVFLSRTLGVTQLIIAINKMDRVNYDQKRYEELKKELLALLGLVGYKEEHVVFIPVSALDGVNITKKSDKESWFDGPTLLEALDLMKVPDKPVNLPLRIPVQDVYTITGVGTVPVGRVETGKMKKGDTVIFNPPAVKGEVKTIEMHHEEIEEAIPGDNIGWNVRGISRTEIRRGDVCGPVDNPPTIVDEFTAQIVVLQHPSAITAGYTPVFHTHTAQVAATILEITKKMDPKTGATVEENPDFIKAGDAAIIKVKPTRPLVIERVKEIPQLGRFAVRDMGQTVAAGMVIDLKEK
ncbi:translation elongation factor EF-1 subunit alpha [ANME-1 cluster archaeon AG-394-G06]|nr:translation elongation factor EF-1 subunit alpha [ANME-1 cluster archaeon AG-394-G06]